MNDDDVHFIDTTFRDGSQSNWASNMRFGMMEPIASDMDAAGFDAIEVPINGILFKKIIRDLKEDPFEMVRMFSAKMPNTAKACMSMISASGGFGAPAPPVLTRLAMQMTADLLTPYRVQSTCNTGDQLVRMLPTQVPIMKEFGFTVALAVSYSLSPRHTDELFAEKTRAAAALAPDSIYLKDQGGLLTVDRVRTLIPIMLDAAGDIPLELHSHCTTGLAPAVYTEAMRLGIRVLHTAIPPASDGSAQPSIFDMARNARALALNPVVDEELLRSVSRRLTSFAKQEGLPLGQPLRYDEAQFAHQIPGGVISNLRFQLDTIRMGDRIEEVKEECARLRVELGYPAMITPYSQHIVTQATINVATGERFKVVIDEVIRFAQGRFGEDSGYTWMDQDLRDRLLALPRAKELEAMKPPPAEELTLRQVKDLYGDADMSDEEVVLRAIMQGRAEVDAMRSAGPPRRYYTDDTPLLTLLNELDKHRSIRYISVERGGDVVRAANRNTADLQPAG
jgi:oxaloacetate decarboxylase (Na+ extruding) subunit alpha